MRWAPGWLVTLAIAAVLVVLASVLVFPRLLHPPLSPAKLGGVTNADRRVELAQAQAKLQNDARATLLQGIAGLLLLAGAVATWWQIGINRDQLEVVRKQALESDRQAREQLALSRQGQITERFSRAIEQLGNKEEEVRSGGIYTLERVAKDSPEDRNIVQAVIGAYVRSHARWLVGSPEVPQHPTPAVDRELPWLEHRLSDVQAAMWVLGRRPPSPDEEWQLYLSRVDLRGVFLAEARLSNAQLRHTNLARGYMPEVRLDGADLEDADLREANLQGARLTSANLGKAHLQRADMRRADLRGANLQGAQLEGADLTGAHHDATTVWPEGFQPG
jgi:hypothetical protein